MLTLSRLRADYSLISASVAQLGETVKAGRGDDVGGGFSEKSITIRHGRTARYHGLYSLSHWAFTRLLPLQAAAGSGPFDFRSKTDEGGHLAD